MSAKTKKRVSRGIVYVICVFMAFLVLFPFLLVLLTSFKSVSEAAVVTFSLPEKFLWENFAYVIEKGQLLRAFKNSVIITGVGTAFSMCATILAAYPLSKPYMYARKQMTMLCVFTMLFGGGMIPTYLVIRDLGIIDTYWALWLPGLVSTYNMLVMRTFFTNISSELEDAARIDGCNEIRLLLQIFLPLSLPCIATIALFYAVGFWLSLIHI